MFNMQAKTTVTMEKQVEPVYLELNLAAGIGRVEMAIQNKDGSFGEVQSNASTLLSQTAITQIMALPAVREILVAELKSGGANPSEERLQLFADSE